MAWTPCASELHTGIHTEKIPCRDAGSRGYYPGKPDGGSIKQNKEREQRWDPKLQSPNIQAGDSGQAHLSTQAAGSRYELPQRVDPALVYK